MKISVNMSMKDVLEYLLELQNKHNSSNGSYGEQMDELIDLISREVENQETRLHNAESQIDNLQSEIKNYEWTYQAILPHGYKTFDTIFEAASSTGKSGFISEDEYYIEEGNIFWKACLYNEDLDGGLGDWYTVIGQKVDDKYIVIKWHTGFDFDAERKSYGSI